MSRARANDKGQKLADRGNPVLSHDAVKLLKTQDAGYLKTIGQTTRKKRERLEEEILVQEGVKGLKGQDDGRRRRRHLIFVESKEEQKNLIETLNGSKADNDDGRFSIPPSKPSSKQEAPPARPPPTERGVWFEVRCPLRLRADEIHITGPENGERPSPDGQTKKAGKPKKDLPTLKTERRLQKLRKRAQEGRISRLKLLKRREKELLVAERELELQRAKLSNSIGGVSKAGFRWKVRERKK